MTRHTIGGLRHRLELQSPIRTPAGGGAADIAWQTIASVFAEILPRSGQERFVGDTTSGEVTHLIRIRRRPGVTPAMRFAGPGRLFDIRSVIDEGERRRWLICACTEQTS